MAPKVSLAAELADVIAVLEGIEVRAEDLAVSEVAADWDLQVLASTVGIVRARLTLLRMVVIGAADAALVLDRRNLVDRVHAGDDPGRAVADVIEDEARAPSRSAGAFDGRLGNPSGPHVIDLGQSASTDSAVRKFRLRTGDGYLRF